MFALPFHCARKSILVQALVVSTGIPALLHAYAGGPPPRHTGAPGDQTCARSGCHTGIVNSFAGSVAIRFASGLVYTPGVRQRWTVTVTDPLQRGFGFQATARLESNITAGQAGTFHPVDSTTQVLCDDDRPRGPQGCPSNFSIEFIQHTGPKPTNSFEVDWTPPATNSGAIRIYVAGNATNLNNTSAGDHIYTASYILTPAVSNPGERGPIIADGGIVDSFHLTPGMAPNTWMSIFGSGLAGAEESWDGAIQNGQLPTELGGVRVTVNNLPAVIRFISPSLINFLAPEAIEPGEAGVVVHRDGVNSAPAAVLAAAVKPSLYAPYREDGRLFVTAVALDGTFVGKPGLDPRVTRAARPGEVLQIFGTGFGPVTPSVSGNLAVSGTPEVAGPVSFHIGGIPAGLAGFGNLVAAGLYQFNVTVPNLADGDVSIAVESRGVKSGSNIFLTVQR